MVFVYSISSQIKDYLYVGLAKNVDKRFDQHQKGFIRTTKPYRPFKLIYTEPSGTRKEARRREKHFKSGIGKEYLRRIRDHESNQ